MGRPRAVVTGGAGFLGSTCANGSPPRAMRSSVTTTFAQEHPGNVAQRARGHFPTKRAVLQTAVNSVSTQPPLTPRRLYRRELTAFIDERCGQPG